VRLPTIYLTAALPDGAIGEFQAAVQERYVIMRILQKALKSVSVCS